jgi:hypothetical protein
VFLQDLVGLLLIFLKKVGKVRAVLGVFKGVGPLFGLGETELEVVFHHRRIGETVFFKQIVGLHLDMLCYFRLGLLQLADGQIDLLH